MSVTTSNDFTTETPTRVRVLAEYQLFSDVDAETWWSWIQADVDKQQSLLAESKLLYTTKGIFGLQYLYFLADLYVPALDEKSVEKAVRKTLNLVVADTDIIIHRVTALVPFKP